MTIDLKAIRAAAERERRIELYSKDVEVLLDKLEAAEKDAARYRWLKRERVESNYEGELSIEFECGFDHWNDIDAAIDAAMKEQE